MTSTDSKRGPRVSIGLPVYNGERYISETLDSLLAQTFQDFELIICDNASGDRTERICRTYAAKDKRIRYFRNSTNLGSAKNYRLTFDLSTGEYFRWANCDDLFAPISLERCVDVLDRKLAVVLTYPKTKLIDEWGHVISDYEDGLHLQSEKASQRFAQQFAALGQVNAIYGLMRTNVLRRTGLIRNFIGGDYPLIAELTLYGTFWEIPEFLFYRRLHPGASSSIKDIEKLQEFYDPLSRGRLVLYHWNQLSAHSCSVWRAPIGITEKLRLGYFLVRLAVGGHRELAGEMVSVLRKAIRTIAPTA
jgi:glycosyltransferase involved in cell wall biosynthesis